MQTYVIITPCRNEGRHLQRTIASVVSQNHRPSEWVVVNDGSTDDTAEIIAEAAKQCAWIHAVHRADRGFRMSATGVMEAFCEGYKALTSLSWEFLVKLDGDVSFAPDYFHKCLAEFSLAPRLGIGGGTVCQERNGCLVVESQGDPRFHVRGATKIYRRMCWESIGGLINAPGWDTLDEVKANMLGWETRTFPGASLLHHRETGAADGVWRNAFKNGRGSYVVGYHPMFMLMKGLRRAIKRPYLIESAGLLSGFVSGYFRGIAQIQDKVLVRYLRKQQVKAILGRDSIWAR